MDATAAFMRTARPPPKPAALEPGPASTMHATLWEAVPLARARPGLGWEEPAGRLVALPAVNRLGEAPAVVAKAPEPKPPVRRVASVRQFVALGAAGSIFTLCAAVLFMAWNWVAPQTQQPAGALLRPASTAASTPSDLPPGARPPGSDALPAEPTPPEPTLTPELPAEVAPPRPAVTPEPTPRATPRPTPRPTPRQPPTPPADNGGRPKASWHEEDAPPPPPAVKTTPKPRSTSSSTLTITLSKGFTSATLTLACGGTNSRHTLSGGSKTIPAVDPICQAYVKCAGADRASQQYLPTSGTVHCGGCTEIDPVPDCG